MLVESRGRYGIHLWKESQRWNIGLLDRTRRAGERILAPEACECGRLSAHGRVACPAAAVKPEALTGFRRRLPSSGVLRLIRHTTRCAWVRRQVNPPESGKLWIEFPHISGIQTRPKGGQRRAIFRQDRRSAYLSLSGAFGQGGRGLVESFFPLRFDKFIERLRVCIFFP